MGRPKPTSTSTVSPESDSDLTIKVVHRSTDPHPWVPPPPRVKVVSPPPPPKYQPFRSWLPWLVPTIVAANVVLFVVSMYANDCPRTSKDCVGANIIGRFAFQSTRENPLLGPSAATLQKMGALEVTEIIKKKQPWRLVTCMWLHAGVFHILANMLSLVFVGIRLEREFGFVRIGLLYVISGIGGSLSSSLFVRTVISVGASGSLFGLLGGMLSELLTNWTIYENKLAALLTLLLIIAINLAVGVLPHVDNFAHVGGFITGFFLGFVLLVRPQYGWVSQKKAPPGYYGKSTKSKYKTYQYTLFALSLLFLIAGLSLGLVLLLRGIDGNDHCHWCHYLSCVPTPLWTCQAHCTSNQYANQLNLTCVNTNKTGFYVLQNDNSTSEIELLCSQLCSS